MAIDYARLEYVKRSSGKNAVAKSAYNGKLSLEFEGNCISSSRIYDWSKRGEQPMSHAILLPDHVVKKFLDPKILWNHAEQFEKRKDAQVAIDFVLALPDDKVITDAQRIEMAHTFAKKYFVSKGYGVQVDIHHPSQQKSYDEEINELKVNERNVHAHFLITIRRFNEDGKSFCSKKTNDLNPEIRGSKHIAYGGIEWNKLWRQFQNEYFEEKGLDLRVDLSGAVAQKHLGPLRMRSIRSSETLINQEERIEKGRTKLQNSSVLLQKITETKSIFTKFDVELFLQKNLPVNERDKVREAFWKNPDIVQLYDKESHQVTSKFSSIEIIDEERKILRLADRIHEIPASGPRFAQVLLGKAKQPTAPPNLNSEQSVAFNQITQGKALSIIEGLAGTGKSYLLLALKEHYESMGYKVRAFGPDNATVKVLREKGFTDASSVHRFLFKNHFSKRNKIQLDNEVWLIDESSKLANRPLLELLKSAEKNKAQVIFSGNSAQLSSVERSGMFNVMSSRYGHVFLSEIQRQNKAVDREISKLLATGDAATAVNMIARTGGFAWTSSRKETLIQAATRWAEDRLHFPYASPSFILAHTNEEVRQINDLIHAIRIGREEVSSKEFDCNTIFGNIRVSEGDWIEFRDNPKELEVKNGDRGVLISASEDQFVVAVDKKKVIFNPKEFTAFQLAYASTNFRSQGGTLERVIIAYSPHMHQKLFYVARSRHVRDAHCIVSRTDASCLMELKQQIARKGVIENTLNYTWDREIEKFQKMQQREKNLQELCSSDSLLSRTKGYGFKAWDSLKTNVYSFVEQVRDRQSDSRFYVVPDKSSQVQGRVIQVKEENFLSEQAVQNKQIRQESKQVSLPRNNAFQKLAEDKKELFKNYCRMSESASALYAIVQSESAAAAVSNESTKSYLAWQEACKQRNLSAFELIRGGAQHKAILGTKGFDILQDRATRYEQSLQPKDSLESQLKDNIESLLYRLFPDGPQRRDSRGFRFGSNGSLAVCCIGEKKGCYFDHEKKEGGNLLGLIEKKLGLNFSGAKSWAHEFLKESTGKMVPSHFSTAHFVKTREETWTMLSPPSNTPLPELKSLSRYLDTNYRLTSIHPYCTTSGDLICYTLRLEPKQGGKKIVLPLSYGKSHPEGTLSWNFRIQDRDKLIYNAQLINKDPEKPVLIVEGEKTADAAHKMLGKDYVVVSWLGGAAAASAANWRPLQGREVFIWPDNDPAGFKAADDIGRALRQVGVKSLKMVSNETLKDLPLKWDLADPLPEGKPSNFIRDALLRADSKAISIDRLSDIAARYGMSFEKFNEIVCKVDDRLRADLEKQCGSKSWELEAFILAEATKGLTEKSITLMPVSQKERVTVRGVELNQTPTI